VSPWAEDAAATHKSRGNAEVLRQQAAAKRQGATLVHFSAQRKRFLWEKGCI